MVLVLLFGNANVLRHRLQNVHDSIEEIKGQNAQRQMYKSRRPERSQKDCRSCRCRRLVSRPFVAISVHVQVENESGRDDSTKDIVPCVRLCVCDAVPFVYSLSNYTTDGTVCCVAL